MALKEKTGKAGDGWDRENGKARKESFLFLTMPDGDGRKG